MRNSFLQSPKRLATLFTLIFVAAAVVLASGISAFAAPDTGIVPDGYFRDWNPGIPGGIPDNSAMETFVTLDAASYGNTSNNNARTAINNAITSAGAKAAETGKIQVVQLSEGVFYVSGTVNMNRSMVVLRGAGAGKTFIRGIDSWTGGEAIVFGTGPNSWSGVVVYDVAEDVKLNATSVKLTTGSHGYKPGDVLVIDRLADGPQAGANDGSVEWAGDLTHSVRGTSSMYGPASTGAANGRRFVKQYIEVDYVDAADPSIIHIKGKINFDFPLIAEHTTPKKALYPQVWNSGASGMQYMGLEGVTLQKLNSGNNIGINMERNTSYSWIKDVETDGRYRISRTAVWRGIHIEVNGFRNVVSGCYVHDTGEDGAGAQSYGIRIQGTDGLIENNIVNNLCKPILGVATGGGNVIAYNYVPNVETIPAHWMETALDISHGSYCHADLYEGNMSANISVDTTHGNNGFNVIFRNFATGENRDMPVGKIPLRAINIGSTNNEHASIGNVLWAPGSLITQPDAGAKLIDIPRGIIGEAELADELKKNNNGPAVYGFSMASVGINGPDRCYASFYRHMDYDYLTNGINYVDPANTSALPNSLYADSAPAFFEGYAWPWVNPAGATHGDRIKALPAYDRYERILVELPPYKSCECCEDCICTCDHSDGSNLYCKGECMCYCGCGNSDCICCVDIGHGGAFPNLELDFGKATVYNAGWGQTTSMHWGFRNDNAAMPYDFDDLMKYNFLHVKLKQPFDVNVDNMCVFIGTGTNPNTNLRQITLNITDPPNAGNILEPGQTFIPIDLRPIKASGALTDRAYIYILEWGSGFNKVDSIYLSNMPDGSDGYADFILKYDEATRYNAGWGQTTSMHWGFRDSTTTMPYDYSDYLHYDYLFIKLSAPFRVNDDNVCVFIGTGTNPNTNLRQITLNITDPPNAGNILEPGQTLVPIDLRPFKAGGALTDRVYIYILEWGAGFDKIDAIYLSNAADGIVPGGGYYYTGGYTPVFTVTYDANFPEAADTSGAVPVDGTRYRAGNSVTVQGNTGGLSAEGYAFKGWTMSRDGSGTVYGAAGGTAEFTIGGNVTLYAKWAPVYRTVGFRVYDEDWSVGYEQRVRIGDPVDWAAVEAGYTFYGDKKWSDIAQWIEEGSGEPWDIDTPVTVDVVLYPVFLEIEVYVTGTESLISGAGASAAYVVSVKNMPLVSGIEIEFEIDGGFLSAKAFTPINFDFFSEGNYGSPIYWKNDGNKWTGKAILVNYDGVSGDIDILRLEFGAAEGIIGVTEVKLNYIKMSYGGAPVAAVIVNGSAATVFNRFYSRYDLNKDGVVNLNDLTFALQYFMARSGDPDWDKARVADINNDGSVDIEDLILILANYTVPYYSDGSYSGAYFGIAAYWYDEDGDLIEDAAEITELNGLLELSGNYRLGMNYVGITDAIKAAGYVISVTAELPDGYFEKYGKTVQSAPLKFETTTVVEFHIQKALPEIAGDEVVSIKIKTIPAVTTFAFGESGAVSGDGGVITVSYVDPVAYPDEDVPMTASDVTIANVNTSAEGEQAVAVGYGGMTADLYVMVLPEGTHRAFTFNRDAERVRDEGAFPLTWTTLPNGEGVLRSTYRGSDQQKIDFSQVTNIGPQIRASQRVKFDMIFTAADYAVIPDGVSIGLVVAHPANGWWGGVSGSYGKSAIVPYIDGYYKLTMSFDISAHTANYAGSSFYLQPQLYFPFAGPVYYDNFIFYTPPVYATAVAVDPAALTIGVNGTAVLTPVFTPANVTDSRITWSSSDPTKVEVDANGNITAKAVTAPDKVVVTVTTVRGGLTGACEVTVTDMIAAESIQLSSAGLDMIAGWGKTETLAATVLPANTTLKDVVWSSDNNAVAKVRNGMISAIGAGTARVRAAWAENPAIYAECVVTVSPPPAIQLSDGSKRVRISGTQFVVGPENKRIWMNGVNTPWISWDDFGSASFNYAAWDAEFAKLHENGVNASRVWILCRGEGSIIFNEEGYVTGMTDRFWNNVDKLFELAEKHQIYIMATLASFDCFNAGTIEHMRWRAMMSDGDKMDSYVENYVIPFVNHYGSSDYLWSIDVCNEIEWESNTENTGGADANIPWTAISEWVAKQCVGIHKTNPETQVTLGLTYTKYMVDRGTQPPPGINVNGSPYEGNMVADARLASYVAPEDAALARLDYYSPHYYAWVGPWFGSPFAWSPTDYRLSGDRPAVIGETSAMGSGWTKVATNNQPLEGANNNNTRDDYAAALELGWQGVFMWTSNGVDTNGGWGVNCPDNRQTPLAPAAVNYMAETYPDLIFPIK